MSFLTPKAAPMPAPPPPVPTPNIDSAAQKAQQDSAAMRARNGAASTVLSGGSLGGQGQPVTTATKMLLGN